MDVLHTAFTVSDLDRTKEFYIDHLGLETSKVVEDGDTTMHFVKGESATELQFNYDPDGGSVDPGNFDHVAMEVDDTDAMVEYIIEETEGALRDGPMDDGDSRIAFVEDPDRYGIELIS